MSVKKGDILILQIGGVQVGGLLSNSFAASADMLDATTKDSSGVKEYVAGEYGWTMNCESLYDPTHTEGFSESLGYLKAGTELDAYWGGTTASDPYWNGNALAMDVELNGPKNELSNWSLGLQGSGAITEGAAT